MPRNFHNDFGQVHGLCRRRSRPLGKAGDRKFHLAQARDPQSYAIGLNELWEVPSDNAQPCLVVHTGGWPLDDATFGGAFLHHLEDNKVTLGFVVGLDYQYPWLSPP